MRVLLPSLTISSSGQPYTIKAGNSQQSQVSATVSGTLTVNTAASRSLTGSINLNAFNTTSGANIYSVTINMTLPIGDMNNGIARFVLDIPSSPLWTAVNCQFDTTTSSSSNPSCYIARTVDIFHYGSVGILEYGFVYNKYGSTPSSSNWDPRADLDASGVVDVTDVSIITLYYGATVFLPLATLSMAPANITFSSGNSATSTITLQSYSGFAGPLTLSPTSNPVGLSCTPTPGSVSLTAGGSANATISCAIGTGSAGNYTVTVTAIKGSLRTSGFVTFHVQDFSLSISPASITVSQGNQATFTISLSSLNGFSGTVTLSASVSPIVSGGPTCTLSRTSIILSSGGAGSSTLTVRTDQAPHGTYTVTITATSGATRHTASVTLQVTS